MLLIDQFWRFHFERLWAINEEPLGSNGLCATWEVPVSTDCVSSVNIAFVHAQVYCALNSVDQKAIINKLFHAPVSALPSARSFGVICCIYFLSVLPSIHPFILRFLLEHSIFYVCHFNSWLHALDNVLFI